MRQFRGTRAAIGVITAAVLALQLLGLYACGRKPSNEAADRVAGERSTEARDADAGRNRTGRPPGLKPGDEAPLFSLPGSDGRTYRLIDYRGKQAVVLAWFAKAFSEA